MRIFLLLLSNLRELIPKGWRGGAICRSISLLPIHICVRYFFARRNSGSSEGGHGEARDDLSQ